VTAGFTPLPDSDTPSYFEPAQVATPAMKRIQRKRTKGWRMPEGAVYVGRPAATSSAGARVDQPCHADVLLELANS
jgi:hypothetical protein